MTKQMDIHLNQNLILEQEQYQAFLKLVKEAPERPPEETLVAYDEPFVIAARDRNGVFKQKKLKEKVPLHVAAGVAASKSAHEMLDSRKDNRDCTSRSDNTAEINEILMKVFPPQVWREDDKIYQRNISTAPATRNDIAQLQNNLDEILKRHSVKGTGLDEKRRKYFGQCFDELTRQEIIRCLPRGLLLLRIRDEVRMSLKAYEELYLSNTAYGLRKAVRVDVDNQRCEDELNRIIDERRSLLSSIDSVKAQLQQQQDKFELQMSHYRKLFTEERENLRRHNQNMRQQLEAIVNQSSSKKE